MESSFKEYLIYERQLAKTTVEGYVFFTSEFLKFISKDPLEVRREDIKDFFKYLRDRGIKSSSMSNYVISLRTFYNWLGDLKDDDELRKLCFYLKNIIRISREKVVPEVPSLPELDKLRQALQAYKSALSFNKESQAYKIALRDTAIFETLIATGARNSELRAMLVCDVDLENNAVFIRNGKANHQRVSIFSHLARQTLLEHLSHSRLKPNDKVFVIRNGNMLNYIIKRWAKRAGINLNIHAHSFRHFHVTHAQRKGVPVQVVADQVGHVNLNTTRQYTHFDIDYRRENYKDKEL